MPERICDLPVNRDIPVMHVKTNCLSDMLWGVSEVYTAIDWSKGYKEFLEGWMRLVKGYSRFAWNATVKGGQNALNPAKTSVNRCCSEPVHFKPRNLENPGTTIGTAISGLTETLGWYIPGYLPVCNQPGRSCNQMPA